MRCDRLLSKDDEIRHLLNPARKIANRSLIVTPLLADEKKSQVFGPIIADLFANHPSQGSHK